MSAAGRVRNEGRTLRAAGVALALAALGFGCRESIVAPGSCPELCPAGRVQVVDTTITDIVVGDSSYQGYFGVSEGGVLFLSDLDSLQAGAVVRLSPVVFTWTPPIVNDTVVRAARTPDSVTLSFTVADRDTAAHNVWVLVYRLPFNFDTTITYGALQSFFADSLLVDSVHVPDSVTSGSVVKRLRAGVLDTIVDADSGVVSLAFRVRASTRTALSLASSEFGGAPSVRWYMRGQVPRDTLRHTFAATPDYDSFVFAPAPAYDGTRLVAGGLPSSRTILRFGDSLPPEATDSLGLVRATLILTPTRRAFGRPREVFRVSARGVVRDVGAKSSIFADTAAGGTAEVVAGDSGEIRIEVGRLLRIWGTASGDSLPRALMLLGEPEGLGMGVVTVAGRGAGAAAPRLRITYVRPYEFGVP